MSGVHRTVERNIMKKEKELAEELGVEREMLKEFRKSGLEGWVKQGNWVAWTPEGEHAVRNEIQKMMSIQELSEPLPVSEPQDFVITKIPINSRLIICGDVFVKVKNNKNFLKGMRVRARPPTEGRSWVMVGRCLRWRGRY